MQSLLTAFELYHANLASYPQQDGKCVVAYLVWATR